MGNGVAKLRSCCAGTGEISRRYDHGHEGLGHSFYYVRRGPARLSSFTVYSADHEATTTFRSISGASVSANSSTTLSTALTDSYPSSSTLQRASTFESSDSFASLPLQPVPRGLFPSCSGDLSGSSPIERGFLSGPIERGFLSGPIDRGLYSGPMEKEREKVSTKWPRSLSHSSIDTDTKSKKKGNCLINIFKNLVWSRKSRGQKSVSQQKKGSVSVKELDSEGNNASLGMSNTSTNLSSHLSTSIDDDEGEFATDEQNLQWAQGKAGEDRVHIVISEEHGWVFVGIYDGFNGPDAPDYLLTNLYAAVQKEIKGLLWNDKFESAANAEDSFEEINESQKTKEVHNNCDKEIYPSANGVIELDGKRKQGKSIKNSSKGVAKNSEDSQNRCRCEGYMERAELNRKLKDQLNAGGSNEAGPFNHTDVLKALSQALSKTEDAYLEMADQMVSQNPELALMGSCVLAMLMKGEDVYLMNVGDSRAVLAQKSEPNFWIGKAKQDLKRIEEEIIHDDEFNGLPSLTTLQLTMDHSTYVEEEVERIRKEHPDDASAVMNDRVKGYLKVTRAFGAGFLKQPKWNDTILEIFRIDYVGSSPYITCSPSVHHHKLSPRDRFLILSSDGLYQYFTNEEAVAEVESFLAAFPEGDPAQHLIEEVLFRAARKYGMDFHELLDIPQGDRRRYHDDVSVIIISLEGRIWRSFV